MKSPDPASLQNLNDIVLPDPVGWWPLAPGWYVLIGIILLFLSWFSYRMIRQWLNNRYRRAALIELQSIKENIQEAEKRDAGLRQIPPLLKRTALSAYPRSEVASLSGHHWHEFLNSKVKTTLFNASVGETLDRVCYDTGDLHHIDPTATAALLKASQNWLKHHQASASLISSKEQ